eukprot:snap_masked-scaffold_10-processed-gene-9.20-mRNA-1 protein AED:1.00 eAED:1.00 QI:0/-1/0/0/-1/1/1/0/121
MKLSKELCELQKAIRAKKKFIKQNDKQWNLIKSRCTRYEKLVEKLEKQLCEEEENHETLSKKLRASNEKRRQINLELVKILPEHEKLFAELEELKEELRKTKKMKSQLQTLQKEQQQLNLT